MKKLVIAVTLSAGVLGLTACSSDNSGEETVVVETEAGNITKDDFYNELKAAAGEQVLQQMVIAKILEENYDVPEKEVDAKVQETKDQLGEQFEMALQKQGIADEDAYRDIVKISLLQQEAATEDIKIKDEAIKTRYDRMKTEIQASHILVGDEKTAKEVEKKLKDGEDFAALAKEYSTDKASAAKGGKLGYFSAGKMVQAFTDAAYSLEVGEVSEPVKSEFGYHIIKVTDKRDAKGVGSFEEEKDGIRDELASAKVDPKKAQAKLRKLIDDAKIDPKDDQFKDLFKAPEAPKAEQPTKQEDKSKADDSKKKDESKSDDASKQKEEDAK